jgi:hypothetical protein
MSPQDGLDAGTSGQKPPLKLIRAISFVYRFIALLFITAYREANRDA